MKDIFKYIRDIVTAPIINIMLLFSFIAVVLSFCRFSKAEGFSFAPTPIWPLFIIGVLLLAASLLIFTRQDKRINKKVKIIDGISLLFENISVDLKVGKIQEITDTIKEVAFVLPANSTFIDDCITDPNSALGAFFLKHHGNKVSKVQEDIKQQLEKAGYQQSENGNYPLGTTIILPAEYDIPAKTIITASTIRKGISGIRAEPSSICECIRQVFTITSDKKITKLYMPVLGSGHGGLDISDVLIFLVQSIKHYSKYYHHLKSINIVINKNDVSKLKDIYKIQYLTLLDGGKK